MSTSHEQLERRLAALEREVRELRALKRGEPGRDGKDGRDGRDAKPVNLSRLAAAVHALVGRQTIQAHVEVPTVINAAELRMPVPIVNLTAPEIHNDVVVQAAEVHPTPVQVNVEPPIVRQEINLPPPLVSVQLPRRRTVTDINRDALGLITSAEQIEEDA